LREGGFSPKTTPRQPLGARSSPSVDLGESRKTSGNANPRGPRDAGWHAFGKAFAGGRASAEAASQLAAVHALEALVDTADDGPITLPTSL